MKCFIVRHTLGRKSWYVVTQNSLDLSTPLDTFGQATEWIKTMTGCHRLGCYRLTADLTEVQIFEGVSK